MTGVFRFLAPLLPAALLCACAQGGTPAPASDSVAPPDGAAIARLMAEHGIPGLAVARIEDGAVAGIDVYGLRDKERDLPMTPDSVVSGLSWTKFVFSAYVAQLAAEDRVDLDASIADYLPQPLPAYEEYADLAGDERWRDLTLRRLLSHQSGFPNFRFFPPHSDYDPDAPLAFFQDPGTSYAYSGEGFQIAQLVLSEALDIDLAADLERRFFAGLGTDDIGLTWRESFEDDYDAGHHPDGSRIGHPVREDFDAAGSVNGSPTAFARLVAQFMRGALVSDEARTILLSPQTPIRSAHQFPPWSDERDETLAEAGLAAGLGVVLFDGPQGRGFFKGGHDRGGDNMMVCLLERETCVLMMTNIAKGHKIFPQIAEQVLGETGLPWRWEYAQLDGGE